MNPKPATTRHGIASQSTRVNEKAISPAPNSALAIGMTRPRPMTDRRCASQSAPSSAPQPDDVIRMPSVCGPPWKTVVANTGIITVYGTPTRLTMARSRMIERMGRNPKAYANPSVNCWSALLRAIGAAGRRAIFIRSSATMTAT